MEIHAYARLWGIGQETPPNEPQPTVRVEIGAGALFRIGSGRTDSPRNFIDTGSGDGQHDLELSGFGALSVGRHLGIVGEFRYGDSATGQCPQTNQGSRPDFCPTLGPTGGSLEPG